MNNLIILQGGGSSPIASFAPMLIVLVIIYFFFIRPQNKKQKEQVEFQNSLEKGKEVVTTSGIIGKINKIEDKAISLQVDQKTFIRVTKGAISKEMTQSYLATAEEK